MMTRRFLLSAGASLAAVRMSKAAGILLLGAPQSPVSAFGLFMSGPEFHPLHAFYGLPVDADWADIAAHNINLVCLPIAWEQIQPALSGALDSTYLAFIESALTAAASHSIGVVVTLFSGGRWDPLWGQVGHRYPGSAGYAIGSTDLTQAMFVDVWERLATALKGRAGLVGYGIMNEPGAAIGKNLFYNPNGFKANPATVPWVLAGSPTLTPFATTGPTGRNDGWSMTSAGSFGNITQGLTLANVAHVMSIYAKCAVGTETFKVTEGGVGIGAAFTATTSWQRFERTWTPSAGFHNEGFGNWTGGHTVNFANIQLELGTVATAYESSPWINPAQAAIDAIRAIDATTAIYANGFPTGNAERWLNENEQFILTGSNIIIEAHQFFDNTGGTYPSSYDVLGATPTLGATRVAAFLQWCADNGKTGFLGSFGVPNDDSRWVTLEDNFMAACFNAGVGGAGWYYGTGSGSDTDRLSMAPSANGNADSPQIVNWSHYLI